MRPQTAPFSCPRAGPSSKGMVTIAVVVNNLVLGPARLYANLFGATEPADSTVTPNGTITPPGGSWIDVGGTDGGVNVEIDSTYTALVVDQIIMDVGARLTDIKFLVAAKLSELTLANINQALNQIATAGSGSGYNTLDIPVGSSATQPAYAALIVDGWAPMLSTGAPALRRSIIRKVLCQTKVGMMYDKKTQQSIDCNWQAYFVSGSINPVHIVDQAA
jgi:hypothetical protein